jgi:hypothetical protein
VWMANAYVLLVGLVPRVMRSGIRRLHRHRRHHHTSVQPRTIVPAMENASMAHAFAARASVVSDAMLSTCRAPADALITDSVTHPEGAFARWDTPVRTVGVRLVQMITTTHILAVTVTAIACAIVRRGSVVVSATSGLHSPSAQIRHARPTATPQPTASAYRDDAAVHLVGEASTALRKSARAAVLRPMVVASMATACVGWVGRGVTAQPALAQAHLWHALAMDDAR